REYINASVDIGRRPSRLTFDRAGNLTSPDYPLVDMSLPIVINLLPFGAVGESLSDAIALAAKQLDILAVRSASQLIEHGWPTDTAAHMVPYIPAGESLEPYAELLSQVRAVEIDDAPGLSERIARIKKISARSNGQPVVIVRLGLSGGIAGRVVELAQEQVEALHLYADYQGRELQTPAEPRFVTDAVAEVHEALIRAGLRDTLSLIVSGGIALAEHVAKIMICGADIAGVDIPILLANQCRVCLNCRRGQPCPVRIDTVELDWSRQRIINLFGSWHAQIIEVLGAMGLREVRRLRGESGRAMFFRDLERENFAPIFGQRRDEKENAKSP
ncbi:MAG: hypothetical protein KAT11_08100, partial [Phycisphaerae bacterium]|nr:hypothetical protein [Phycisphaerae bacterium]